MNDAGFLRVLSAVLAGAALIFFIVTIILVAKYKIISAIRLEIASKKNVKAESKGVNDENISGTISVYESSADNSDDTERLIVNNSLSVTDEYTGTVPAIAAQPSEDEYTGTVPAVTGEITPEEIYGTVPVSFVADYIDDEKKIPENDPDKFIIQTEIVVVHSDITHICNFTPV